MWKRGKNKWQRIWRFINLIISPPPFPPLIFPSYVCICVPIVHDYLCQSQIWFYNITWTWKGTCFMSMLLRKESYFLKRYWNIYFLKIIITTLHTKWTTWSHRLYKTRYYEQCSRLQRLSLGERCVLMAWDSMAT